MVRLLPRNKFDNAMLIAHAKSFLRGDAREQSPPEPKCIGTTIDGASVDALLQSIPVKDAFHYSEAFGQSARPDDRDDPWRLLKMVFSLHFWPESNDNPLEPLDYLSGENFATLCKIFVQSRDPEIRARLGDIIWLLSGDKAAMQIAVDAYLESGLRLEDPAHWGRAIQRYRRAGELVLSLRRRSAIRRKVGEFLLDRVQFYEGKDRYYLTEQALEILFALRACKPDELCQHAYAAAENACVIEDYRRARACYALIERISRSAKDRTTTLAARSAMADLWAIEAERLEAAGDALVVRHFWRKAILAYRRIGNEEKAAELRARLRNAKRIGRKQLRSILPGRSSRQTPP